MRDSKRKVKREILCLAVPRGVSPPLLLAAGQLVPPAVMATTVIGGIFTSCHKRHWHTGDKSLSNCCNPAICMFMTSFASQRLTDSDVPTLHLEVQVPN